MSPQANADPAFQHGAYTANPTPSQSQPTSTPTITSPSDVSYITSLITQSTSSAVTTTTTSRQGSTTTIDSTSSSATSTTSSSNTSSSVEPRSGSVYVYDPSVAGAAAVSVLYLLVTIYHFHLSIYVPYIRKSVPNRHKYTIPLFLAACLLTLGFTVRTVSVASESGRSSFALFSLSTCAIIIAPIFICASLYLTLAHLIRLCLPHHGGSEQSFLGLSPRALGRVFVTSDVLSFLLQGAGSAIAASGDWQGWRRTMGEEVLIVGLAMQLGTFTLYMVILGLFCKRASDGTNGKLPGQDDSARKVDGGGGGGGVADGSEVVRREFGFNPLVRQVVKGLWIASVLIEIRSIYRTIEFGMGADGYLFRHEWPLWALEALPIWVALLVLGIYHPATWLQQKRRSAFLHDK